MKSTIITRLLVIVFAVIAAFSAGAQGRIDKLVNQLEKKTGVTVTYTENRNPKTKKIVKQSTILNGNSSKDAEALWQAFEAERVNSIKVVKTRNESFVIKFEDKNYVSSYILSVQGGNWSLVISKKSPDGDGFNDLSFDFDFDGCDFSGLSLNSLESLDGLDALEALDGLKSLDIDGNVKVYKDGKLFYESPKTKKSKKSSSKSKSKSTSTSVTSGGKVTQTITTTTDDGNTVTYIM